MEVTGKIIIVLPEVSGTSKTGNPWKKREYVLETHDTYPKRIHFDFFGERVDRFPLEVGQEVKLSFDIESREYQGRWYTSIRGWNAETVQAPMAPPAVPAEAPQPFAPGAPATPPPPITPQAPTDDLPF